MADLEKRDNEVYRSIFEATPVSDSARTKAIEKKKELEKISLMNDDELGKDIAKTLEAEKQTILLKFCLLMMVVPMVRYMPYKIYLIIMTT